MKVTPGAQLAWMVAAREARSGRRKEIEPEHLFCGLLKVSEQDDKALQGLVGDSATALTATLAERDLLGERLQARSLPSTKARHRLRRILGQGDHEHTGRTIHRSEATRKLFAAAADASRSEVVEAVELLEALLDRPTAAISQVMREVGGTVPAAEEEDAAAEPQVALPDRVQDLLPLVKSGDLPLPDLCGPQVQVLGEALAAEDVEPVLLICEPSVAVEAIVAHAAQQSGDGRLLALQLDELPGKATDETRVIAAVGELLHGLAGVEAAGVLANMTGLSEIVVRQVLGLSQAERLASNARFIPAISDSTYRNLLTLDASVGDDWREIWLHRLSVDAVPKNW